MIKPSKHMNLDISVVKVISEILKILKENNTITYEDLLDRLIYLHGEDIRYNFIPALNFLFIFGKLNYYPKKDAFEYINKPSLEIKTK